MDAKLVVVGGEARIPEVNLKLPLTVGRGRSSGLPLPHPLVSRQHCEIREEEGKLVINDLGSLNGTFVGDQRINEPTFLRPGELLTIGTVTFRAVYEMADGSDLDSDVEGTTNFEGPAGEGTVQLSSQTVSDMANVAEIAEAALAEETATVDEAEEIVEVAFTEVEAPGELEVVDEAELTVPLDVAATIPAPTNTGQAKTKRPAMSAQTQPAKPKPKAAAADVEIAEEVEDIALAAHDTKEVSPSSGDTESADGNDDDLQSFLQALE